MELKKDLHPNRKKSIFRLILGVLFWGITISALIERIIINPSPSAFDWLFIGIFAINAVLHSAEGLGFNLGRLFGKAFIQIDQEKISFKANKFDKAETTFWNDIESIEFQPSKLKVISKDNTLQIVNYSTLSYELVEEIKEAVNSIASEKGVGVK